MKRSAVVAAALLLLSVTGASGGCGGSGGGGSSSTSTPAAGSGATVNVLVPATPGEINGICQVVQDDPEPGIGAGGQTSAGQIRTYLAITDCKEVPVFAQVNVYLQARSHTGRYTTVGKQECDVGGVAMCEVVANCYEGSYFMNWSANLAFAGQAQVPPSSGQTDTVTVSAGDCNDN